MEYLVTAEEMKAYDTYTIEELGIPSVVLMERAALGVCNYIVSNFQRCEKILCVCGTGNNGGDGLAVARLLIDSGYHPEIVIIGDLNKMTEETRNQYEILQKYGVRIENVWNEKEYDLTIDALFGIGLKREISGIYKEAIDIINTRSKYVIAVDIPSGINADTGKVMGCAVKANVTITMAYKKAGTVLYPGCEYTGKLFVEPIGVTNLSFHDMSPHLFTKTDAVSNYLPTRKKNGNKGTFGKILIVAGSENMTGAPYFTGKSALKAGAGMVKLMIPEVIKSTLQCMLPEALNATYKHTEGLSKEEENLLQTCIKWADLVTVGPGLSNSKSGNDILSYLLKTMIPMVIDADALNMISENSILYEMLKKSAAHKPIILTPHMGELSRLLHKPIKDVVEDELESCNILAEDTGCIVVGKSARTYVVKKDASTYVNIKGNDKMATAGSGDVLCGIISALLAQGMEPIIAAQNGVYIHASIGDQAAQKANSAGITASDLIDELSYLS